MNLFQNVYRWILTHKLIVGLTVLFILIVLTFFPQKEVPFLQKPVTPQPIPTKTQPLRDPKIFPLPGTFEAADTQNGISLFFELPVDLNTVKVASTPPLEFEVNTLSDFPKRVILTPTTPWQEGATYTITISKGIKPNPEVVDEELEVGNFELMKDITLTYTITSIAPPYYPEDDYHEYPL